MPTVGILTFTSRKNSILDLSEPEEKLNFLIFFLIQLTLVISKSKGPSKTLRDIRTSTYQTFSIEEKNNLNNQNLQMTV